MQRQFPTRPILCVGGAVIQNNAVALVRRRHDPNRGEWTIPGGAVEIDERIKAAVRREVREETGLVAEPLQLITVFERIIRKEGRLQYHYVVLDYACKCSGGELCPASDALDARWVLRRDLARYKLRSATVSVIQQAFKILQELR
ncbi:MAG TPA: NUDIX hydrolase [Terriglobia bacterium]|nr:NUDIX hydrolase [Terriglobia bacterium]